MFTGLPLLTSFVMSSPNWGLTQSLSNKHVSGLPLLTSFVMSSPNWGLTQSLSNKHVLGLPASPNGGLTQSLSNKHVLGLPASLRSPSSPNGGLTQSLSNKHFVFVWLFLYSSAQSSKLVSHHRIKKASHLRERLCSLNRSEFGRICC